MTETNKPTTLFWVIAVIALLWNLWGIANYVLNAFASEAMMDAYTAEQMTFMNEIPAWSTAVFAIATWGGLIGAILLIARRKWAAIFFLVSAFCVIIQTIYLLTSTNQRELFGDGMALWIPIVVIVVQLFLYWWSKKCTAKGWLR